MVTDPAAKQRIAQHLLARLDSDKLDAVAAHGAGNFN